MTVTSTPAFRSRIAAECRMVCGEIFFSCRVGQDRAAVAVYLVTRRSRASRLSGVPARVGNSGSAGRPPCSMSQAASTVTVVAVSGGDSLFTALAQATDVRAGAQVRITDGQLGEFGGAQAGLAGQHQHGAVADGEAIFGPAIAQRLMRFFATPANRPTAMPSRS